MDKDLIKLLKSSKASDRIKGINRLVDDGHPDARKIIGSLYKKESDDAVKKAAQDAASRLKEKGSSKHDAAQAQKLIESAMSALIDNKTEEARALAAQAFRTDPKLREDDYATGLAGEITGLERAEAVEELLATIEESDTGKSKGLFKRLFNR